MKTLFTAILISLYLTDERVYALREVLVVSNIQDGTGDFDQPIVEVYDFLSRTWRLFEAENIQDTPRGTIATKPHAARLINQDNLVELDLEDPSVKLASLPPNVEGGATLYYGDTLCLAGGYNTKTSVLRKEVVCWNPLSPQNISNWVSIPPMTHGRYKAAAVVLDGKLFVTGGYNTITHEFMDSVEVFDDVTQQWYPVSPLLNGGRAGHKVEAVNGKLYVIGGWRKFQFLDEVEEYNPLLNKWTIKSKMPQPLAYFGSVVKNGQIYIVGGISGFRPSDEHNALRVYSPYKDVWADIQPPMSILKGKVTAVLTK